MGIETEYEPEGYECGKDRYLPDFRIVGTSDLLAIKPSKDEVCASPEWWRDVRWQEEFLAIGISMFIIAGRPQRGKYCIIPPWRDECVFADCLRCEGTSIANGSGSWGEIGLHTCGDHDRMPVDDRRVNAALCAAMSERFDERKATRPERQE
jgi:hypothetical protein